MAGLFVCLFVYLFFVCFKSFHSISSILGIIIPPLVFLEHSTSTVTCQGFEFTTHESQTWLGFFVFVFPKLTVKESVNWFVGGQNVDR